MRLKRALFLVIAFCAVVVVGLSRPAFAQPTSEKQAAAEDLFQRGKARMAEKDFAAACTLFAESYGLDAAGGTLQNLAVCYEELGKWASAYARFQELRSLSKSAEPPRTDRVKLAEEHIERLLPKLSRLLIVPTEQNPGLVVRVDGTAHAPVSWSEGIVVDPGAHMVQATAPGKLVFTMRVDVDASARTMVRIPPLANAPPAPGSTENRHPTRTLGFVIGGVGVVALGAGGVFGLLAGNANSDGEKLCVSATNPNAPPTDFDPTTSRCYEGSTALRDANAKKDEARRDANVANVLVPLGVVAVAVGVYLIFRTSRERAGARVAPSLDRASFEATF